MKQKEIRVSIHSSILFSKIKFLKERILDKEPMIYLKWRLMNSMQKLELKLIWSCNMRIFWTNSVFLIVLIRIKRNRFWISYSLWKTSINSDLSHKFLALNLSLMSYNVHVYFDWIHLVMNFMLFGHFIYPSEIVLPVETVFLSQLLICYSFSFNLQFKCFSFLSQYS